MILIVTQGNGSLFHQQYHAQGSGVKFGAPFYLINKMDYC